MSIAKLAQHLASHGRGEDSMLVHMTPHEVAGLQKLAVDHGGSLSINPHTGLVEAGFLSSILPTLAGIGLSFVPGVGPLLAAGLVGGGTGLLTGDWKKGLVAGIGAYGGAGIGGALSKAGTSAGLGAVATNSGGTLTGSELAALGPQASGSMLAAPTMSSVATSNAANAGQGLMSLNPMTTAGRAALGTAAKDIGVKNAYAAVAPAMADSTLYPPKGDSVTTKKEPTQYYHTSYSPGTFNPKFGEPGQPYFVGQGYGPGEYSTKYAAGGPVGSGPDIDPYTGSESFNGGGPTMQGYYNSVLKPNGAQGSDPLQSYISGLQQSGPLTTPPQGFAAGGMTQGPGDGVSDSIPATIGGTQQAELSGGEFIIPARIVSEIGNGSSEAGSKALYAMMARVQAKRAQTIGGDKFSVDSGAAGELPV